MTYEYEFETFSGNGMLAMSTVRGLRRRDGCTVLVICARPHCSVNDGTRSVPKNGVVDVAVPREKWNKLDKTCGHEVFANGLTEEKLELPAGGWVSTLAFAMEVA